MNDDYQDLINSLPAIRVAIVGKDPFPTNPTGVPFCKPTWEEQWLDNCSGFHVLNSIGISEAIKDEFSSPIDCFNFLALNGIVFLNISYNFIGGPIRRGRHLTEMQEAFQINRPIMQRADLILLCGEANKNRWNDFEQTNFREIVHPDIRNRFSRHQNIRDQWNENWDANSLNRSLGLGF